MGLKWTGDATQTDRAFQRREKGSRGRGCQTNSQVFGFVGENSTTSVRAQVRSPLWEWIKDIYSNSKVSNLPCYPLLVPNKSFSHELNKRNWFHWNMGHTGSGFSLKNYIIIAKEQQRVTIIKPIWEKLHLPNASSASYFTILCNLTSYNIKAFHVLYRK